jgi:hypothetical protein
MRVASVVAALILLRPCAAFAYVDPGSGSLALQLLLAGFAGVGVVLRLIWGRIRAALGLPRSKGAGAGRRSPGP